MANGNYLLGRQPILNRGEELIGYELLFRSTDSGVAEATNATYATASVITNALTSFGIEEILGPHKGFINLDLELLMHDSLNILPKNQVVIELLETMQITPALVEHCRSLKQDGFTLALDDHEYSPLYHELYEIVDIVKVDLTQSPLEDLEEMVRQLRTYELQLLAEKVETQEEFNRCLELGFDLFQGYYFAKPSVLKKRRMEHSGHTLLKLMRLLEDDAEVARIEETFREDPGLTCKLLFLVNSVSIGLRCKIDTIRHAIMFLGRQQIKRWIQMALFADSDQYGAENPLMEMAAVRASFMENMSSCHRTLKTEEESPEKAFMTGILSVLQKVYDISIDDVIQKLNLSEDISEALAERKGELGNLLHMAELLEQADFRHLVSHLNELDIGFDEVLMSQKRAFTWRSGIA
ncbi:EAL and HDOD domain-containing protein [Geobacter sp. SVR]|uniref:EAL and HDOD domain-containing protein n=1 Tax=Geobacter sp. SVR TaxID=2495594 RepID=UPI00143EFF86|nr:EAL domain-containing protein [Geobacter sp. SVR]BCS55361.1 cyclic diguanylate phosphodiesterase [Geobacter sp. SVR]GCF87286.1 cyclic diguanylate phosphodiesterase [Geobacter sp. SVR]